MDILNYFKIAVEKEASDIHLAAGSVAAFRIHGELEKLKEGALDNKELEKEVFSLLDDGMVRKFKKEKELDFSHNFNGVRMRINLHYQEGKIGLTARFIPRIIPKPEELGFDETIYKLTHFNNGLILVTGPSGSGKSTTLASMIDIINEERRSHIITIEDPIEYLFEEKQSIIEQRELGVDTKSFSSALKYALRQDPNIIMVGEMRDLETISAALTAAETGHLVLSTLHTSSAPETIERIVDVFPAHQQQEVMIQIASVLRAVIAQQLLPKVGGGRIAAREIMINNQAVFNLIKRNELKQIYTTMQTGRKEGMITMNKCIDELLKKKLITEETARNKKKDFETHAVYY